MSGKLVHPTKYLTLMERAERSQWNRLSVVSCLTLCITSINIFSSQLILQRNYCRIQGGFALFVRSTPVVVILVISSVLTTLSWTCLLVTSLISCFPKVLKDLQTMTMKIHLALMFISMEDVLSGQKIYSF